MRIGPLRQRLDFQRITSTSRTSTGQVTYTWGDFGTFWACARVIGAKEVAIAGQLRVEADIAIDMRYVAGIDMTMRVVWDGQTYQITSVRNPDSRGRKIVLSLFAKAVTNA